MFDLAHAGLDDPFDVAAATDSTAKATRDPSLPLVIAHRGASGYLPEHTLPAYRLAIRMGVDFVEPDVVMTRDGVLVARHEPELSRTTDIADRPEFADRRTVRTVDGRHMRGWFAQDLTLAEIKTLRARERWPEMRPYSARFDGRFDIPTFDEILAMVALESQVRGEVVGVYVEPKHPTHHAARNLALGQPLVDDLNRHGLDRPNARVYVQSFEPSFLRDFAELSQVPRAQLVERDHRGLLTPAGLREISTYASVVGPNKSQVVGTSLVADAHFAGLAVHAWTFRAENGALEAEVSRFFELGVDGVFCDHPDRALAARSVWSA